MAASDTVIDSTVLGIDCEKTVEHICARMREILRKDLSRQGFVIAMSGGIDSSVCAALAVKALGPEKVFGLLLPEQDSSGFSTERGELLARHLGIDYLIEDIAPALEALGCYRWRDNAIKRVFPEYGDGWKNKIVISGGLQGAFNHFRLVVESPSGERKEARLGLREYLEIVAATNYKQRIRKTVEYFHADRLNYAVIGTPNRLEYDQGFFVKNGDGSADIKPIAHLYKTQVYALARHMQLPDRICEAVPTTDTYSLSQGQDEFYFALPYQQMDLALWAHNHGYGPEAVCDALGLTAEQVQRVYKDIEAKRRTTRYLHLKPVLVEPVSELDL
jgi:NAD+ synthase